MKYLIFALSLAVLILSGCIGNSLNSAEPDYMKSVSAIKDGNGLQIYYILADKEGAMTTSDGKLLLQITQAGRTLFMSNLVNVTKSQFQERKVGMGNFEHEVIMHYVGRIPYESMRRFPESGLGKVEVMFQTPTGENLTGDASVFF